MESVFDQRPGSYSRKFPSVVAAVAHVVAVGADPARVAIAVERFAPPHGAGAVIVVAVLALAVAPFVPPAAVVADAVFVAVVPYVCDASAFVAPGVVFVLPGDAAGPVRTAASSARSSSAAAHARAAGRPETAIVVASQSDALAAASPHACAFPCVALADAPLPVPATVFVRFRGAPSGGDDAAVRVSVAQSRESAFRDGEVAILAG